MNLKKFGAYTFLGSLPWCFVLAYLGTQLGPRWEIISRYFHVLDIIVVIGIIGAIGYLIYKHKKGKTQKTPNQDGKGGS